MDMRYIEFALADRFFYDKIRADALSSVAGRVTRYIPRCEFSEVDWNIEESNGWRYIQSHWRDVTYAGMEDSLLSNSRQRPGHPHYYS